MTKEIELAGLSEKMRFDIRLQISLRSNAINIMKHYENKEKFKTYINEREEKIRILLNCEQNPVITENGKKIFP